MCMGLKVTAVNLAHVVTLYFVIFASERLLSLGLQLSALEALVG